MPDTRLVCLELILPYACHDVDDTTGKDTGYASIKAQKPLLANWGGVSDFIYIADVGVRSFPSFPLISGALMLIRFTAAVRLQRRRANDWTI